MSCCSVVDLRQYTIRPGRLDDLVDVFDRYLVDGQEAVGMHIVGQFRDLDDPERFVWIRGFPGMPERAEALNAFYYGPVWKQHATAANDTMVDSDNALILRPIDLGPGYPVLGMPRPPVDSPAPASVVWTTVYHRRSLDDGFVQFFRSEIQPVLTDLGAEPVASFETLDEENNFPPLPARTDPVLAWLAVFPDDETYAAGRRALAGSTVWHSKIQPEIDRLSAKPPQQLRLRPTSYSHLR
jgi:hypothetical protein